MKRRDFIAAIGGAAAWPLTARAQQRPMPVIGYLSEGTDTAQRHLTAAFRRGLSEGGFLEGRNVEILYRFAESYYDRLPALVSDLVRRRVAVIVALGSPAAALVAKSATSTIPIVFASGADPVEFGLVKSLNRPGGNITGVSFLVAALTQKRLELLHELRPVADSIGFFDNPTLPRHEAILSEAEAAAGILGVHLVVANASTPAEIETAFPSLLGKGVGALLAAADPFFFTQRDQLAALAARYALPTIYNAREFVDAGGLMSYGTSLSDAWQLAGTYAGRILKGDKPADLPVQQSTRIEMVLNLKTAKALGIEVPTATLLRATEVIE